MHTCKCVMSCWGFTVPAPTQLAPSVHQAAVAVRSVSELAGLLRMLRRREARRRAGAAFTYRELAARTGWSHAIIGEYFSGTTLPPTDRFDQLIQLLGATGAELGPLATARDRVEELRRQRRSTAAGAAGRAAEQGGPQPRQLPAPVAGFLGRGKELAELDRVATAGQTGTGPAIAAVCGGGGVGKTALVRHWAHHHAAQFPDGQLYIDLHGFSPRDPVTAVDALGRFLRALGAAPDRVPAGLDERASRYRTALAGRRVLVVLDNARSAEQVRPLVPGAAGSLVVVTSRDSLAGLVAADGAQRIPLDGLAQTDAVGLLAAGVTGDRVQLATLARLCGGLPLALRAVCQLAAAQPDRPLADLAAELDGDAADRAILDAGDGSTVRQVLSWSYDRLSPGAARLFRLLGADPGPDSSAAAMAGLAGVPVADARPLVLELCRVHLIREVAPGRYTLLRVLRAYARDLLDREAAEERLCAIRRLLDHYLATADAGDVPSEASARAWRDAERRSVEAAARSALRHGFADHAHALGLRHAPAVAWPARPRTRESWGPWDTALGELTARR